MAILRVLYTISMLEPSSDQKPPVPEHERRKFNIAKLSEERRRGVLRTILGEIAADPTKIDSVTETLLKIINRVSLVDPFTKLENKGGLMHELEFALSVARQSGTPLTLLYLDGDQFKRVNDELGHTVVGDRMILAIANGIRNARLRPTDVATRDLNGEEEDNDETAGRHGGDEFAVILPGATLEDGRRVGERILQEVQIEVNSTVPEYRAHFGRDFTLTAGYAQYDPQIDTDATSFLERAETDMRVQKQKRGLERR